MSLLKKDKSFIRIFNKMGPNIEPLVYLINVFGKHSQCHLFLHPVFCFKYKFTKIITSSDKP